MSRKLPAVAWYAAAVGSNVAMIPPKSSPLRSSKAASAPKMESRLFLPYLLRLKCITYVFMHVSQGIRFALLLLLRSKFKV